MRLGQFLVGLALLGASGAANSAEPAPAAASAPAGGRWVVDWGHNQCSLVRESGGAAPAGIALQLVPGTDAIDIVAVDQSWKSFPVKTGDEIDVRLDGSAPVTARVLRLGGGKERLAIVALNIDRGFIDGYAKAGSITIEAKNKPVAHMRLPNAAKAVQALDAGERDALQRWKVDTAALATLQRRATSKKSMAAYMSDNDYPAEALSKREQGTTVVRLTVDADGKVPECGVVSSSGSRALDLQTCAIFIRRVEYDPAISAEGRPVRSVVFTRLTWRLM